jgi:TRAP-type transport system small permease protein
MVGVRSVVSVAHAAERAIQLACNFLLLTSGLGLLCLLSIVVVLRYAFESSLSFSPDLSELLFCIFVVAGIVQAARRGAHVATLLLLHTLQGGARLALALFIHGVTACAFLLLAWYAFKNAVVAHDQTTPVLQIPWSVGYGCLSIGLALVAICSLATIVRYAIGGEEVKVNLADTGPGVV